MKLKNIKFPASFSIKFSPNRETVVALGRSIYFASLKDMKRTGKCHPFSHSSNFDFDPSGKYIAIKNTGGEIAIVDCEKMEVVKYLGGKSDGEGCELYYSPCGEYLISGTWGGKFKILNINSGFEENYAYEGQMISSLSCSKNKEQWLVVRNTKYPLEINYFLEIWSWPFNISAPKLVELGNLNVLGAAMSPNGEMAALATYSEVLIFNLKDSKKILSFKKDGGGTGTSIFWFGNNQNIAFNTKNGFSIVSLAQTENELVLVHKCPVSLNYSSELQLLAISTWEKGTVEHFEKFT
jgi:hypothetical protein